MLQPVNINKGLETVEKSLNNLISTADEKDAHLTQRHAADMASNSWLAKAIRPMLAIYYSLIYGVGVVLAIVAADADPMAIMTAIATTGTIVVSIIGFFFQSRRAEKMADKQLAADADALEAKLRASIEIERLRFRQDLEIAKAKAKIDIKHDELDLKKEKIELKEEKRAKRKPLFGKKNK